MNENFSNHSLLAEIYGPENGLQNLDDIISPPPKKKNFDLIMWLFIAIITSHQEY